MSEDAYELGAFQIHCAERVRWHGGRRLNLTGKPFELLVLLVRNAGRTLDKLLYEAGQLSSASEAAATWSNEARERGDMEAVSTARRWLARCAVAQGTRERAREHIDAAIEVSQTYPVPLSDWRSYAVLHALTQSTADAGTAQVALAEARQRLGALAEQLDQGVHRERLYLEAERMGVVRAQPPAE